MKPKAFLGLCISFLIILFPVAFAVETFEAENSMIQVNNWLLVPKADNGKFGAVIGRVDNGNADIYQSSIEGKLSSLKGLRAVHKGGRYWFAFSNDMSFADDSPNKTVIGSNGKAISVAKFKAQDGELHLDERDAPMSFFIDNNNKRSIRISLFSSVVHGIGIDGDVPFSGSNNALQYKVETASSLPSGISVDGHSGGLDIITTSGTSVGVIDVYGSTFNSEANVNCGTTTISSGQYLYRIAIESGKPAVVGLVARYSSSGNNFAFCFLGYPHTVDSLKKQLSLERPLLVRSAGDQKWVYIKQDGSVKTNLGDLAVPTTPPTPTPPPAAANIGEINLDNQSPITYAPDATKNKQYSFTVKRGDTSIPIIFNLEKLGGIWVILLTPDETHIIPANYVTGDDKNRLDIRMSIPGAPELVKDKYVGEMLGIKYVGIIETGEGGKKEVKKYLMFNMDGDNLSVSVGGVNDPSYWAEELLCDNKSESLSDIQAFIQAFACFTKNQNSDLFNSLEVTAETVYCYGAHDSELTIARKTATLTCPRQNEWIPNDQMGG
ncbi:hypothetical protein J4460_09015 [Candidatus Woesearchaeota archaeon]|nr:hypothetical protein [Candidatus Woesearchaeota archaeon]HIH37460.1 hypothetical protein [Candidatus Woesearchaeota archaeon]